MLNLEGEELKRELVELSAFFGLAVRMALDELRQAFGVLCK